MRKSQQHYCMRKRFFAWAKIRFHGQNSLRLVNTLVTPPRALWLVTKQHTPGSSRDR